MGYYYFVWLWCYTGAPLFISSASSVTLKEDNLVFLNDVGETEKLGWRSLKSRAKVIQEQICYVDVSSQRLLSPSERHRGHVLDPVSYWSLAVRAVLDWRSRVLLLNQTNVFGDMINAIEFNCEVRKRCY